MTPEELITNLRTLGPQDVSVVFAYLADQVYEARLAKGQPMHDKLDFKQWLLDLAAAAVHAHPDNAAADKRPCVAITRRELDATCSRCGHIHEGDAECGVWMGAGRFCRCEVDVVPA